MSVEKRGEAEQSVKEPLSYGNRASCYNIQYIEAEAGLGFTRNSLLPVFIIVYILVYIMYTF